MTTQLEHARAGKITDAMRFVGEVEGVDAELVRAELAAGRLVIPANQRHLATESSLVSRPASLAHGRKDAGERPGPIAARKADSVLQEPASRRTDSQADAGEVGTAYPASDERRETSDEPIVSLRPVGIGRVLRTKVNANIGTSSVRCSVADEIEKMRAALDVGADAIMDLSTGGNLDEIRAELLAHCPVPFGTVPIYQVIEGRNVEDVDTEIILRTIEKQARQGVDFFTIHAGVLREHLPLIRTRVAGIVSRGGALLAKWMIYHNRQNPLYEMFDDLCDLMVEYDVCFSLGDGLRPGAIADATDEAQIAELRTLGELTQRAQEHGCQVMVEGPGHVPFHQIEHNMKIQQEICRGAPFYVLGPLVTDIAPGYDHITSAIGGCAAAFYGASFLCYVTPREHLGLPNADDVRAGVVAAKIAAHAADIARGLNGAADRDRRLSTARANLDWKAHLAQALDPATATRMHEEACQEMGTARRQSADYCSMCGQHWCSLRISREIRETVK